MAGPHRLFAKVCDAPGERRRSAPHRRTAGLVRAQKQPIAKTDPNGALEACANALVRCAARRSESFRLTTVAGSGCRRRRRERRCEPRQVPPRDRCRPVAEPAERAFRCVLRERGNDRALTCDHAHARHSPTHVSLPLATGGGGVGRRVQRGRRPVARRRGNYSRPAVASPSQPCNRQERAAHDPRDLLPALLVRATASLPARPAHRR